MATIKIGGMLSTLANDNVLASASQIYDENFSGDVKDQSTINDTLYNLISACAELAGDVESISDSEITALFTD